MIDRAAATGRASERAGGRRRAIDEGGPRPPTINITERTDDQWSSERANGRWSGGARVTACSTEHRWRRANDSAIDRANGQWTVERRRERRWPGIKSPCGLCDMNIRQNGVGSGSNGSTELCRRQGDILNAYYYPAEKSKTNYGVQKETQLPSENPRQHNSKPLNLQYNGRANVG